MDDDVHRESARERGLSSSGRFQHRHTLWRRHCNRLPALRESAISRCRMCQGCSTKGSEVPSESDGFGTGKRWVGPASQHTHTHTHTHGRPSTCNRTSAVLRAERTSHSHLEQPSRHLRAQHPSFNQVCPPRAKLCGSDGRWLDQKIYSCCLSSC